MFFELVSSSFVACAFGTAPGDSVLGLTRAFDTGFRMWAQPVPWVGSFPVQ